MPSFKFRQQPNVPSVHSNNAAIIPLFLHTHRSCRISFPPVACWAVVAPGPAFWLAFPTIFSVFGGEIVHLLCQVRQLDQTLLQVLLQPGHFGLQGEDSLTKNTHSYSGDPWRMELLESLSVLSFQKSTKKSKTLDCLHLSVYWPITGAGVQCAASHFCVHGGVEYGFRYVVMVPGQWGVFRSCSICDEEAVLTSYTVLTNLCLSCLTYPPVCNSYKWM